MWRPGRWEVILEKVLRVDMRIKRTDFGGLIPSPEIGDLGSCSHLMACVCDVNKKGLMYW